MSDPIDTNKPQTLKLVLGDGSTRNYGVGGDHIYLFVGVCGDQTH